jgi:hypothetical protein
MFSPFDLLSNKKHRTVKVRKQNFIRNQGEPSDEVSHDSLNKDETVLVEDSPIMRRRFRRIAQRIRIIHLHGVNKKFRD